MVSDEPVLEASALRSLEALQRQGEADLAREVVQAFLEAVPRRLRGLAGALRHKDVSAIERHAHSLKASAAMVGALRLSARCAELELKAADLAFGASQRPRLEAAWLEARAALQDYLARG